LSTCNTRYRWRRFCLPRTCIACECNYSIISTSIRSICEETWVLLKALRSFARRTSLILQTSCTPTTSHQPFSSLLLPYLPSTSIGSLIVLCDCRHQHDYTGPTRAMYQPKYPTACTPGGRHDEIYMVQSTKSLIKLRFASIA
jgi:hypothetical protein